MNERKTIGLSKYLVLDIETEGLDPKTDHILEVGAIAIFEDLSTAAEFSEVCIGRDRGQLSDFIKNMHGKNGLLDEIEGRIIVGHAQTEAMLDEMLAEWILGQGYTAGQVILAGNSVHFDHAFIKARMPRTAALLHYRVKDIGAVQRELEDIASANSFAGFFDLKQGDMPHRGLADARLELKEWRHQREMMAELFNAHACW